MRARTGNTPEFRATLKLILAPLKLAGLPYGEMERRMGRSGAYLTKLLRGRRALHPDDIFDLADALKLSSLHVTELITAAGWYDLGVAGAHVAMDGWAAVLQQLEADEALISAGLMSHAVKGLEFVRQRLPLFERQSPPSFVSIRARVNHALGTGKGHLGDRLSSIELFKLAQADYLELGDPDGYAKATLSLGVLQVHHERRLEVGVSTLELVYYKLAERSTETALLRGHVARDIAYAKRRGDARSSQVDRWLDRSENELAKTGGNARWQLGLTQLERCWALCDRCELLLAQGNHADAERVRAVARSEVERARRGLPFAISKPLAQRLHWAAARVAFLSGDFQSALEEATTSSEIAKSSGLQPQLNEVEVLIADIRRKIERR